MRFVQAEQYRIAALLQPVQQPEYGIPRGLRADLERDPRNAGLQVDRESVEYPGRLPDGAANALDQHFG